MLFEDSYPAAFEDEFVVAEECECLGKRDMLFFEDSVGKGVFVIVVEDGDDVLEDDCAAVHAFVDEMDGAARDFYAVFDRLPLGVQSRE